MVCLRDAVEHEHFVRDEEIHHRRAEVVARRARDDGFYVVDEFVADETDRAAGEAGQAGHHDRLEAFHDALDDFKAVAHGRFVGGIGLRGDVEGLGDFSVFDDLHRAAGLADDGARVAADERVAPDGVAALDGFEEEGFALAAQFAVGGEGRFKIGEDAAYDRDEIPLLRQTRELFQLW